MLFYRHVYWRQYLIEPSCFGESRVQSSGTGIANYSLICSSTFLVGRVGRRELRCWRVRLAVLPQGVRWNCFQDLRTSSGPSIRNSLSRFSGIWKRDWHSCKNLFTTLDQQPVPISYRNNWAYTWGSVSSCIKNRTEIANCPSQVSTCDEYSYDNGWYAACFLIRPFAFVFSWKWMSETSLFPARPLIAASDVGPISWPLLGRKLWKDDWWWENSCAENYYDRYLQFGDEVLSSEMLEQVTPNSLF